VTIHEDKVEADLLPHNTEAEQALLGRLLADSQTAWPILGPRLKPDHFFEPVHARLFEAISALASTGRIASPIAIQNAFDSDPTLAEIGGTKYLASLAANAATLVSARDYEELIRELAARREAIAAAKGLITDASAVKPGAEFRPVIASHIGEMQRLFDDGVGRRTSYSVGEAMAAMVDRVKLMRAGEVDPNAIKTDMTALDKFTGGLHRGEYIILGGRPSMGKTALAIQIAYSVAERGGGVFYASLEMPVALITPRFASCRLWSPGFGLHYQRILRGEVDDREERWLESVAGELKGWPLIIDDAVGLTAAEIEARAQIAKAKLERQGGGLSLVIVDHIHKLHHPQSASKVAEYTAISGRLAEMPKRLDVPVLALAQLNRALEGRDDKRPQLSDLRESGSIEQDADTVMFVYRPAYYLERRRCSDPGAEADRLAELDAVAHRLELIIEKQRSGPIGTIDLWCDMAANVVRDPADQREMEMAA
jgi:replicative DNA helicase